MRKTVDVIDSIAQTPDVAIAHAVEATGYDAGTTETTPPTMLVETHEFSRLSAWYASIINAHSIN